MKVTHWLAPKVFALTQMRSDKKNAGTPVSINAALIPEALCGL